jgi:hypothetical protein
MTGITGLFGSFSIVVSDMENYDLEVGDYFRDKKLLA